MPTCKLSALQNKNVPVVNSCLVFQLAFRYKKYAGIFCSTLNLRYLFSKREDIGVSV